MVKKALKFCRRNATKNEQTTKLPLSLIPRGYTWDQTGKALSNKILGLRIVYSRGL